MHKSLQGFFVPHRHFLGEWIKRCLEETRQMWGIIKTAQCQGVEESSAYQREPWACRDRCFVRNRNAKKWEMSWARHSAGTCQVLALSPSLLLLPEKFISPYLVGVSLRNTTKDWEKERFITCSKYGEHRGSFPTQCLSKQQNWGCFKLKGA